MANGDSTSTGVELFLRNLKEFGAVGGLRSESFINFEDINVLDLEARFFEGFWDSVSRSDTHDLWGDSSDGETNDSSEDSSSELLSDISASHDNTSSSVSHLTGVSSSSRSSLLESRLEFSKLFDSNSLSSSIISVDFDFSLFSFLINSLGLVNCDLSASHLLLGNSLVVRIDSHSVLLLASDSELLSHVLGGNSHTHEAVGSLFAFKDSVVEEVGVDSTHHVEVRHRFDTTTDSDANISSLNSVGDRGNGLKTRRAHSVNSLARGSLGDASHEHSHSDLSSGASRGEHVSDNNFVNLGSGDLSLLDRVSQNNLEHSF